MVVKRIVQLLSFVSLYWDFTLHVSEEKNNDVPKCILKSSLVAQKYILVEADYQDS